MRLRDLTCSGAVFAVRSDAGACAPAARLAARCSGHRDRRPRPRSRRAFADSAAARAASAAATAASYCCCEISSFATQRLQAVRRRAPAVRFGLRLRCRACAAASRALAASICASAIADAGLCLLDAALRRASRRSRGRVAVIGTPRLRRYALASASASSARARVDRDLVVARIDLDEHRAGGDGLVVLDGTRSTVPPTRAAICVMCPSTCASSVDSRPA